MKRPDPVFDIEYKADRRKHRHRCFSCKRIVEPGERVAMCRIRKGTRVAHSTCANKQHTPESPATTRDVMRVWGLQALKNAGWKVEDWELRT